MTVLGRGRGSEGVGERCCFKAEPSRKTSDVATGSFMEWRLEESWDDRRKASMAGTPWTLERVQEIRSQGPQ